jgi:hypothetical protein
MFSLVACGPILGRAMPTFIVDIEIGSLHIKRVQSRIKWDLFQDKYVLNGITHRYMLYIQLC